MEIQIACRNTAPQGNTERLNRAIEVLVIDGVLIVPDASARVCDLISHEADAVVTGVGFEATDRCSRPRVNGGSGLDRGAGGRKGEFTTLFDSELTIRDVVIHVALSRVSLTPGPLVRSDVLPFGIVGRPGIQGRAQVVTAHQNPVGNGVVDVAGMIGWIGVDWEGASKGINPCPRTQAALGSV